MFSWLANAWRVPELRRRVLFTAMILAIYRLGSWIPAPGVDSETIENYFSGKGGRRFSFTALVVIGDEVDRVGLGYGKAREVPLAISKAVEDAKKNLFTVPKHGQTITHEIVGQFGAARVVLRPASEGTGVIAGAGVRAVLELAGIRDVLAKSLGTTTPINMTRATVNGLLRLVRPEDVALLRGKTIAEVLPVSRVTRARAQSTEDDVAPASPAETDEPTEENAE